MWQTGAPFVAWATGSVLLGLGFTFFSGATEAWLVDGLTATGYHRHPRCGLRQGAGRDRGSRCWAARSAAACWPRSTNLGVPYLRPGRAARTHLRGRLAGHARRRVCTGPRVRTPPRCATSCAPAGSRTAHPPVALMLAGPFGDGAQRVGLLGRQADLLELYGSADSYAIAGPDRRAGRRCADRRRVVRGEDRPALPPADPSALLLTAGDQRAGAGRDRARGELLADLRPARGLGGHVRGRDADPAGLSERSDPVGAAGDRAVLGQPARLRRWRGHPAGARPRRRRLGLRPVVRDRRRRPAPRVAVHPAGPARRAASDTVARAEDGPADETVVVPAA